MHLSTIRRGMAIVALCATAAMGLTACRSGDGKPAADPSPTHSAGGDRTGTPGPSSSKATTPAPPQSALARLPASEIVRRATRAMTAVHSLTADAKGSADGKPLAFDVAIDTRNECTGHISQGRATAKLISTGTHVYLAGDDTFLRQMGGAPMVRLLHGKWMKTAATSSGGKDLAGICDLRNLLSGFQEKPHKPRKGAPATVDGKPAIPVTDKDPKDGSTSTAYIAADGTPYVLKVVTVGGTGPGTVVFSGFDAPVHVGTLPADRIVDVDTLGS